MRRCQVAPGMSHAWLILTAICNAVWQTALQKNWVALPREVPCYRYTHREQWSVVEIRWGTTHHYHPKTVVVVTAAGGKAVTVGLARTVGIVAERAAAEDGPDCRTWVAPNKKAIVNLLTIALNFVACTGNPSQLSTN